MEDEKSRLRAKLFTLRTGKELDEDLHDGTPWITRHGPTWHELHGKGKK